MKTEKPERRCPRASDNDPRTQILLSSSLELSYAWRVVICTTNIRDTPDKVSREYTEWARISKGAGPGVPNQR